MRRFLARNALRRRDDWVARLLAGGFLDRVLLLLRMNARELVKAHRQLLPRQRRRIRRSRRCLLRRHRKSRLRIGAVPVIGGAVGVLRVLRVLRGRLLLRRWLRFGCWRVH